MAEIFKWKKGESVPAEAAKIRTKYGLAEKFVGSEIREAPVPEDPYAFRNAWLQRWFMSLANLEHVEDWDHYYAKHFQHFFDQRNGGLHARFLDCQKNAPEKLDELTCQVFEEFMDFKKGPPSTHSQSPESQSGA